MELSDRKREAQAERFGWGDRHREVHAITSVAVPHSEELGHRERRYLISMGIRTACFVLAVAIEGWPRWVFLAGAVFLPYISVVLANAGVRKKGAGLDLVDRPTHSELPAGKPRG